jgi:hypothetical protein
VGLNVFQIDGLCIIQDSPADWAHEAARMADIYEKSTMTICATWASDSDRGLFSDRYTGRQDREKLKSAAHAAPFGVNYSPAVNARIVIRQHSFNNEMRSSAQNDPLLTRAWCLQERFLAPRTLDFTLEEMYWECKTDRSCECREADRKLILTQKMKFVHSLAEQSASEKGNGGPDIWQEIVKNYSALDLTYPMDRLPALSGLAHRMFARKAALKREGEYLAGLWRRDLPGSLYWHIKPHIVPGDRNWRHKIRHVAVPEYRAPSWSWAAREGQVTFEKIWPDEELKVINATCTYSSSDLCGTCSSGTLVIAGFLAPVRLRYGVPKDHVWGTKDLLQDEDWELTYKLWQDTIYAHLQADFEIARPDERHHVPPNTTVFCLKFGPGYGLVLNYMEEKDAYVRIGTFSRGDSLSSLKIRKRPTKDGTGTEEYIGFDSFFIDAVVKTVKIV